jgi:hypothetical protein
MLPMIRRTLDATILRVVIVLVAAFGWPWSRRLSLLVDRLQARREES